VVAWRCPAETYVMLVWWAANPPTTRLSINVVVQFIGLIVLRRVGALTGTAGAGRQRKRRVSPPFDRLRVNGIIGGTYLVQNRSW